MKKFVFEGNKSILQIRIANSIYNERVNKSKEKERLKRCAKHQQKLKVNREKAAARKVRKEAEKQAEIARREEYILNNPCVYTRSGYVGETYLYLCKREDISTNHTGILDSCPICDGKTVSTIKPMAA